MPIYAFACSACGHQFDRLQKLSDPDPDACPACGAAAVGRQITAPAFRLAGAGWYETDFKKDGDRKRNLAGEGAGGGDGGGKSESAPAAGDAKPAGTAAPAAAAPVAPTKPAASGD